MRTRSRRALDPTMDRGASAVEYGLMVAAIAALIVGIVFGFGQVLNTTYDRTFDCIAAAENAAPSFPDCPSTNGINE